VSAGGPERVAGALATPRLRFVARNGKQSPPRPRISIESTASPAEAAAIAAALERFLWETAPAPVEIAPRSRWQEAALSEGVSVRSQLAGGWGNR